MRLTLAKACPLKAGKSPDKSGGKWFCDQCQHHVHDISGMTADDATRFLRMRSREERTCGEWATDRDGNVLFNLGRTAAAAAALFAATPAQADGLDALPDAALVALFGDSGAQNVRHDLQNSTDLTPGTETEPPPVTRNRGIMILPTPPSTPPPSTHKP